MALYARARAAGGWHDFPDTSSGVVAAADLEKWDQALYEVKSFLHSGTEDPSTLGMTAGTEYVWFKTDGAGTFLDIFFGVA